MLGKDSSGGYRLDSKDAPDIVDVQIDGVTGRFFNIPKLLKQLREDPKKFQAALEKARARRDERHQGIFSE